jgi:hypothetical protein
VSTLSEYKTLVRERDDAKAELIAWTEVRERGDRGRNWYPRLQSVPLCGCRMRKSGAEV